MRIQSVHLTNYRCHADLRVDFSAGFNVIAGVNGCGKTSLLNAVHETWIKFVLEINANAQWPPPLADNNTAYLKMECNNARYRFEPQYPIMIEVDADCLGKTYHWAIQKNSEIENVLFSGESPGSLWASNQAANSDNKEEIENHPLPVLAFYRANRFWQQEAPSTLEAATARNSRKDGYNTWWDASLDSTAFQSWVIGKCLERYQTVSESAQPFDSIQNDELALVNNALALVVENTKGLRYDLKQKSLLVEWTTAQDSTPFENLSDGQRAAIGLVADIARRMCLLNPQLDQEVTNETPGIILIDELDIHLHPKWQRILTNGLKRAFPKVQFIVASHSPQVLGELKPEEIILLRGAGAGTTHPQVSYGLTSSQILEEIMEADDRTPEIKARLFEINELLERQRLEEAGAKLDTLEKEAPALPETAGARALLRRKEILGR
jgi:predicted ATP-binding protein involved in virulence